MRALLPVLLAACYAVLAALAAVVLPTFLPGLNVESAVAFALILALGLALLHETWRRHRGEAALASALDRLESAQRTSEADAASARDGVRQIHGLISALRRDENRIDRVAAELNVLQRLVQELWVHQEQAVPGLRAPDTLPAQAGLTHSQALDLVRDGLSSGRVDLFVQPIVSLPQRRHRLYECFSRIRTPDGHVVAPGEWIEAAAREGLLTAIDNMMLFRCIQLVRKVRNRTPDIAFVCNVSPHSLADKDFLIDMLDFLERNEELARRLVFEIAQDDLRVHEPAIRDVMLRLGGLGVRFSVDQVTQLALDPQALTALQVRFVKLNVSHFTPGETGDPDRIYLLHLRRELSRAGIEMIAEKIESEAQLVELLDYDVRLGQGYLFGEPRLGPEA